MTDEHVQRMLNDTLTCEQDEVSIAADFACHIKALADERDRLLEGYRQMLQMVDDEHRWHYKIARGILAGMDPRRIEDLGNLEHWAKNWKNSTFAKGN